MDDGRRDGSNALKDRASLIEYLSAAIPPTRAIDPTIEFFLQLAIKQLSEGFSADRSNGRPDGPAEENH
jgi:hypothetical protein